MERRSAAVTQVEDFVVGVARGHRLPTHVLDRYRNRGFGLGWRVPTDFSDGVRRQLDVLADDDFPYTPPRIAVANGPDPLAWPHLEADGMLCILPADTAVSDTTVLGVLKYVFGEACRLIEDSITGNNTDDFRREFLSYWNLATDEHAPKFISLLDPHGTGRRISVWRGERLRVVGENPQALCRWLPRWGAKKGKGQEYTFYDGVLIWLAEPLLPAEYPSSAANVRTLAREQSPEALSVLEELAASAADEIDVIVGARTPNGACFAAITLRPPRRKGPAGHKDSLVKGFRPKHVPPPVLKDRYLAGSAKATRANVERADHHWIHGRDQDARQERLKQAHVAILGCGSLGAPFAHLLAQAGVGNLLLVDPDILKWPNVGRHALGAASVNEGKAPGLARKIEKSYPHLGDIAWRRERVGPKARQLSAELGSLDLIVSAMGNWAGENFLNDLQRGSDVFPPILYGWLEPNAVAAHGVFIPDEGEACLRCGMNDKGQPHMRVTDWPEGSDGFQEPACGAQFTPYGPSELCWAHALLAEMAIDALTGKIRTAFHRVWIGSRDRIEAAGGRWAAEWVGKMGDPGIGGVTASRPWLSSKSCPVCVRCMRAT